MVVLVSVCQLRFRLVPYSIHYENKENSRGVFTLYCEIICCLDCSRCKLGDRGSQFALSFLSSVFFYQGFDLSIFFILLFIVFILLHVFFSFQFVKLVILFSFASFSFFL